MSFQDAEDAAPTLDGIAALLCNALEKPGYTSNPNQIYDNMDSDPLIGPLPEPGKPASRSELLQRVSPHKADPAGIPKEAVKFCRANLRQGPVFPASAAASLVHVHRRQALVNAIVQSPTPMRRSRAEALVNDLLGGGIDEAAKLAKQKASLADKTLSLYQLWCYPAADPRKPFDEIGSTRAEAVNTLGLGGFADDTSEVLVRWAHAAPAAIKVCRPTAWDAGADNVYWRPGGYTYKLDSAGNGVQELIHDKITGENLIAPIEELI